jgi:hypothetical protein
MCAHQLTAQTDYETEYGPYAKAREEKEAREMGQEPEKADNDCQNFGNVGQCAIICTYIQVTYAM